MSKKFPFAVRNKTFNQSPLDSRFRVIAKAFAFLDEKLVNFVSPDTKLFGRTTSRAVLVQVNGDELPTLAIARIARIHCECSLPNFKTIFDSQEI